MSAGRVGRGSPPMAPETTAAGAAPAGEALSVTASEGDPGSTSTRAAVDATQQVGDVGYPEDGIEQLTGPASPSLGPPPLTIRWLAWLGAITLVGLGVRLAALIVLEPHLGPQGDAFDYHYGANLLVSGHGFIDPFAYLVHHRVTQGADYPPLFELLLALASALGFKTFFAHQVWVSIIGTATVPVLGMAGREIAGLRVGLIAALLGALYPNIWINDAFVHAETLSILVVGLVLWMTYRFWHKPGTGRAVALGVVTGVAILARDELVLLVLLLVVPVIILARSQSWRRRLVMTGAALLSAAVLVAPWVGYNFSRFQNPVFISTGFGVTLASANCSKTYSGPAMGYWWYDCAYSRRATAPPGDESVVDSYLRSRALDYVRGHAGQVPAVVGARVGRAFGLFRPTQQVDFDIVVELRSRSWAYVGLGAYYALLALTVVGLYLLRKRKVIILPLLAVALNVVVTVMVTFGQTRYRVPFEVVLVLCGAVSISEGWRLAAGWSARRGQARRGCDLTSGASPEVLPHR